MGKKTASIIGIILGIAIIFVGFCVQGIRIEVNGHELHDTPTIGSPIKFGADFYTEMYAVTQDVGNAVNSASINIHGIANVAQRNICNAIENVCDAIGWLIVVIGVFDVAFFVYKKASSEEDNYNAYIAAPSTTTATISPSVQNDTYPSTPVPDNASTAAAGEWKCTCGRIHKDYESSCVCGATKFESKAAQNN